MQDCVAKAEYLTLEQSLLDEWQFVDRSTIKHCCLYFQPSLEIPYDKNLLFFKFLQLK